ncbi:MAG: RidA family protein [Hyphomicrobiaceae bacterium]|nr:RidA family protein [Hyphomicrobiaceae bacterium]MCC0025000.1 RidA family protein [Hyphomicrobiaceae bacterium]
MVKRISTGSPFERTLGYSRAVVDDDMIYVSGTTGYDYDKMVMPEDVAAQARNALETISRVLGDAGGTLRDVVRVRYYLTSAEHVEAITPVLGEYFGDIRPAATMVVAGLIDPLMKVEIEVTARVGAHFS